ncbi:putative Ntn-hydrolase superfamily protein [Micromonospora palomenae]|uniref:Putative Ntn-hydrolase superfamily protein n=1 Tax=Micromonospora palomenae TaxID=1461247 RepID=A0A561WT16_9ACTN|nr:DUF1028 domain-containing protein [Micromonospora palomenae]TWG26997.1 putative Ntn-hydrolase superfamily protein [Micromonospora palomenae]
MTFSLVARSADGRLHGVAVASRFLAAGALVPAAEAEVGAVASQAHANLSYRPNGLALLRAGVPAADVIAQLVAADPGRDDRQLGVVGATGPGATWTGPRCGGWAGGLAGDDWAAQGNILAGPQIVEAVRDGWLAGEALPFPQRLLAALRAGEQAGGDRRGRQSAALLVVQRGGGYAGTGDNLVDLRVDDHPDPVGELHRLLDIHTMLFGKPDPATLLELTGPLADEVAGLLAAAGYPAGGAGLTAAVHPAGAAAPATVAGPALEEALASWAGWENLEERLVPGHIDPIVLAHLRRTVAAVPAPRTGD